MGLALPAYSGELLPSATSPRPRATSSRATSGSSSCSRSSPRWRPRKLDVTTDRAILQGAALVLDAQIDPLQKLALAPALLERRRRRPPARRAARTPSSNAAREFADDAAVYDRLAGRLDDVVVVAVQDAFRTAYLIAAALALLAAALLATAWRKPAVWLATAAAVGTVAVYAVEHDARGARAGRPSQDPCNERAAARGRRLRRARSRTRRCSCSTARPARRARAARSSRSRSSTPSAPKQFERTTAINPRSAGGLLSLLGG